MTKKDLEELRALIAESKQLEEELKNLPVTRDSVRGSMTEHPWISMTIPVAGRDEAVGRVLKKRLEGKLADIQAKIAQMEDWLDGVPDSEMRTILRLRYRNGLSWQQVAFEIGEHDEQYPRRKCKKFLEKVKFDENDEK